MSLESRVFRGLKKLQSNGNSRVRDSAGHLEDCLLDGKWSNSLVAVGILSAWIDKTSRVETQLIKEVCMYAASQLVCEARDYEMDRHRRGIERTEEQQLGF